METIHELAEKYVGYKSGQYTTEELQGINDFKAGYEAAEQWIDVKDELPQGRIIWKGQYEYDEGFLNLNEFCRSEILKIINDYGIINWRPINRP